MSTYNSYYGGPHQIVSILLHLPMEPIIWLWGGNIVKISEKGNTTANKCVNCNKYNLSNIQNHFEK